MCSKFIFSIVIFGVGCVLAAAAERTQRFDADPRWDGHNNRKGQATTVTQNFGYSPMANHAAGPPGAIGGTVFAAAEPAYYAVTLPAPMTFDDTLTASGTLFSAGGTGHFLVGLFNTETLNEWRTPNTVVMRIDQHNEPAGDVFDVYVEYATSKWRAIGNSIVDPADPSREREFLSGRAYDWSLRYDPAGNDGGGRVTLTFDGETILCDLYAGHKSDGATFNRFGLLNVMKHWDDASEIWLSNLTVNGQAVDLSEDPGWDEFHNRRTYETRSIRPNHDFGYCPTHFAGGESAGEMGGLIFRGDSRYPNEMAYYGDRLEPLTLERPLRASGTFALRRAVTDSRVYFGFFHSSHSVAHNPGQKIRTPMDFLGIMIDGLSREGLFFSPQYRVHGDLHNRDNPPGSPYVYPDGTVHDWSFEYDPAAADGDGRVTVTFDGHMFGADLEPGHKAAGAQFDRFGIVTPWVDGNGQNAYWDDLTYTCKQESAGDRLNAGNAASP